MYKSKGCHKGLKLKVASVIVPCSVIVSYAVKTILKGMVPYLFIIQVIPYRIGITENIDFLVFLKIHRHILFLELAKPSAELYPLKHIYCDVS